MSGHNVCKCACEPCSRDNHCRGEFCKSPAVTEPDAGEGTGWDAALADPQFVASLDEGLADVAAGRTTPYTPDTTEATRHRRSEPADYDPTPACIECFKAWDETGNYVPEYACPASPGQQPGFKDLDIIERQRRVYAAYPSDTTEATLRAALDDPRFRAAVDAVFAAPGEFGPAKGYYGADTGLFIDMLRAALEQPAVQPEDPDAEAEAEFLKPIKPGGL